MNTETKADTAAQEINKKSKIVSWIIKGFEVLAIVSMLSIMTASSPGFAGLAIFIIGIYKIWAWIHVFFWMLIAFAIYGSIKVLENPQSNFKIDLRAASEFSNLNLIGIKYIIADIISWSVIITAFFYQMYIIAIIGVIAEFCYLYVKSTRSRFKELVKQRVKFEIKQGQNQSLN